MMDANAKVEIFCNAICHAWECASKAQYSQHDKWGVVRSWCHGAAMMLDLDDEFEARDDLYLLRDIAAQYEFERSEK